MTEPNYHRRAQMRERVAEALRAVQRRSANDYPRWPEYADAAIAVVIEECARIAEETDTGYFDARTFTAQSIAKAIRALSQESE